VIKFLATDQSMLNDIHAGLKTIVRFKIIVALVKHPKGADVLARFAAAVDQILGSTHTA